MIEVLVSFVVMLAVCMATGFAASEVMYIITKSRLGGFGILIAGIVAITVFTGFLSVFMGIGAAATILVLAADVAFLVVKRTEAREKLAGMCKYAKAHRWEMFFYVFVAAIISYFASRGNFHTDTNLYHAANIRIYEEIGLAKGMGNAYWNYAYNSMYHAFAAFFSEHWILAKPWHTTSAFLAFIFSVYSIHHFKTLNERRVRFSDGGCIAILIYVLNILYYINSPATDFAAMLFALYMMTEWVRVKETSNDTLSYANLCLLGVYILTLKISAGLLVIAVVYPAFYLIKEKRIGDILKYLSLGIFISLPYFIRNYLISGWLIYPFKAIDVFNVQWKMPVDFMDQDVAIITGSGKCLFDMPHDLPINEWVPIWWRAQEYYGKLLFLGAVFAGFVLLVLEIYKLCHKKFDFALTAILVGDAASMILWFVQAPFIRYGLAFLLFTPCLAVAASLSEKRYGFRRIVMGLSALLITFFTLPFVDHYFGDNIGFISMHKSEPYYIWQKDYDQTETVEIRVGDTVINGTRDSINSYYAYPSISGITVDDRLMAFGDSFEDGFYMHK